MPFLGLLDVAGIQEYILANSRLQAIAAASEQIEALNQPDGLFQSARTGSARLCLAAGGNAVYTAPAREDLQAVFRTVSGKLLRDHPGLEVRGVIYEYPEGALAKEYRRALRELDKAKLTQPRPIPFEFPGLRREWPGERADQGSARADGNDPIYPRSLDDMILHGTRVRPESSAGAADAPPKESAEQTGLMAVVCMDGLGMGRRLNRWLTAMAGETDEAFLASFACWSEFVKRRWDQAWQQSVEELDRFFPAANGYAMLTDLPTPRRLKLRTATAPECLKGKARVRPVRRIYQGGDDLTYLCDARIALAFTAALAARLEEKLPEKELEGIPKLFHDLTVSIGVVFVDSHFPFSRAVRMAEEVRESAKCEAMERNSERPPSCLDWWVNRQGAQHRPKQERTVRPCGLRTSASDRPDQPSWAQIEHTVLKGMWKRFGRSRNKLKDLVAAAEEGPEAVRRLLTTRPLEDDGKPVLDFLPDGFECNTGFYPGSLRTPLLDAGELYDIHVPYPASKAGEEG